MEAGNRCFDDRVPEEVNRRIIDQCSDVLLPYTERSRQNLLREGFPLQRILVTGNPIHEVINYYAGQIGSSQALAHLQLERQGYFLVTMHRAENVDLEIRLRSLTTALEQVQREYGLPVICSLHPHTRLRMENFGLQVGNGKVQFLEPMGLFDFIALEQQALCVLSDSGTVQEECCIFRVPAVTVRDTTERPETIECGSNILSGVEPDAVLSCVKVALQQAGKWQPPAEYLAENVTRTVVKVLLGGTIRPLC
jgi:UDP-N-acetylglucosamine 2-epimerase (non-hydrolysing)